ncbi:MAG TPA: 2-dehydropantoate 2-reductase N-terminal domain-containing protein, partial [Roseiarcus sp.]|nr:2-dehydropantoate 2-reductase N-terminal domain-containing protein [Roseiarcus sp.]
MRRANVIGVAGAGAWGVALANAAAAAGRTVILWGRDEAAMRAMAKTRASGRLPGVALAGAVEATSDLERLRSCEAIFVATPAQSTRETALRLAAAPGSAPL